MSVVEIATLSSKGQILIPNTVRKDIGISGVSKLVVISDGENIMLRPIEKPKKGIFKDLVQESRKYAKEAGLKKEDIKKAIDKVRRENRT